MNFYEIDYLDRVVTLLKEAFALKKYKAMHPALAIFVGIFMLPFFLFSVMMGVSLIISAFAFKVVKMPIDFLHGLVHSEGQQVKHATQFVIYWLSWPLIFTLYALLSFSLLGITFSYAVLSINTYIWTLGGYKFHAFIGASDFNIGIRVDEFYNPMLPFIYVIVCAVILLVQVLIVLLKGPFMVVLILLPVSMIFSICYSVLALAKNPATSPEVPEYT